MQIYIDVCDFHTELWTHVHPGVREGLSKSTIRWHISDVKLGGVLDGMRDRYGGKVIRSAWQLSTRVLSGIN